MTKKIKQPGVIELDSLSGPEVRKLLARDVLDALDAKRMLARRTMSGEEPFVKLSGLRALYKKEPDADARKAFAERCIVCGKGALFVAAIDRFDKVRLSKVYNGNSIILDRYHPEHTWLRKFFSRRFLAAIEIAFEGNLQCSSDTSWLYWSSESFTTRAFEFYLKHAKSPTERLRAIMQNIIENNGNFKP